MPSDCDWPLTCLRLQVLIFVTPCSWSSSLLSFFILAFVLCAAAFITINHPTSVAVADACIASAVVVTAFMGALVVAVAVNIVVAVRQRQADEGAGGELALWEKSAAGFCAGIVNSPFRVVFERVKSVMQVMAHPYAAGVAAIGVI